MVIEAVTNEPPVRLARLAPLVSQAAEAGDPVALALVNRAADHLCDLVTRVHPGHGRPTADSPTADSPTCDGPTGGRPSEPVVLAGSVVGVGTPVERAVRRRLAELEVGPVLPAGDGAAGAAWLAIRAIRADHGDLAGRGGLGAVDGAWRRVIG
jgi:hypothetical protein